MGKAAGEPALILFDPEEVRSAGGPASLALELNLEEWPLFSRQKAPQERFFEVRQNLVAKDGSRIGQVWRVTASHDHTLPGLFDEEVFMGVMAIVRDRGGMPEDGRVRFSTYELCKAMRKKKGGDLYRNIWESLDRIAATSFYTENAFYVVEDESLESYRFPLWTMHFSRARSGDGRGAEHHTLKFDDIIIRSYNAGYLKLLDHDLWFGLSRPLAKALYRLIDRRRAGTRTWEVEVRHLRNLLQISARYKAPAKIWQVLAPSHEALKREGFLADYRIDGDDVAHYRIEQGYARRWDSNGGRAWGAGGKSVQAADRRPPSLEQEAMEALKSHGVFPNRARALVKNYGPEKAFHVLEVVKSYKAAPNNPGSYIASVIESGDPGELEETAEFLRSAGGGEDRKGAGRPPDREAPASTATEQGDEPPPVPALPDVSAAEKHAAETVWPQVLQAVAEQINAPSFRVWFEGTVPHALVGGLLTIAVPNDFAQEYIGERFKPMLEEALAAELGPDHPGPDHPGSADAPPPRLEILVTPSNKST